MVRLKASKLRLSHDETHGMFDMASPLGLILSWWGEWLWSWLSFLTWPWWYPLVTLKWLEDVIYAKSRVPLFIALPAFMGGVLIGIASGGIIAILIADYSTRTPGGLRSTLYFLLAPLCMLWASEVVSWFIVIALTK